MTVAKLHQNEPDTGVDLVRRLLAAQFPRWAGRSITPLVNAGSSNALFRLGADLVVRLPRTPGAVAQIDKERRWLPLLAPTLPLAVPAPLAAGQPGAGFPWRWAVYRWLDGVDLNPDGADLKGAARDLAAFILALQAVDPAGGPPPGGHNAGRGEPLAQRDEAMRAAAAQLAGQYEVRDLLGLWEAALAVSNWAGPPLWLHGDLLPANLLVRSGRLGAVIDWGCLGVGDPAADVMAAWTLLTPADRPVFRAALAVDAATWARARGWALSFGVIALPYYQHSNPALAAIARRAIDQVLLDDQT